MRLAPSQKNCSPDGSFVQDRRELQPLVLQFEDGIGIIQIEHAAFFGSRDLLNLILVSPYHRSRARFKRRQQQFVVNRRRKNHRVAPLSLEYRQYHWSTRIQKNRNQRIY